MPRPEKQLDAHAGPVQAFASDLRALRDAADTPSYRVLAKRAGFSATTLSVAASGTALPTLDVTLAYVQACGADPGPWRARWCELSAAQAQRAAQRAAAAPGSGPTADPGRRRRPSRRRGQQFAAMAVALAACAALAAASSPDATRPSASAEPEMILAQPTSRNADPLVVDASFGWLPAYARDISYDMYQGLSDTLAHAAPQLDGPGSSSPARIDLIAASGGTTPPAIGDAPKGDLRVLIKAPDVNGHPAYWITYDAGDPTDNGDTYLTWQSGPGRWLQLHGVYLPADDILGDLHHVATDVIVGNKAIALPLRLSGMPENATPFIVGFHRPSRDGSGPWDLLVAMSIGGGTIMFSVAPTDVGKSWERDGSRGPCKSANGLIGCARADGPLPPSMTTSHPADLLDDLTLLSLDETHWTTHVINP